MSRSFQFLGLGVLLGLAPLVFLPTGGEFENTPKMGVLHAGIAILILLRMRRLEPGDRLTLGAGPLDLSILAFHLLTWVSLFRAVNPQEASLALLHWTAVILFYFHVSTEQEDPAETVFLAATAAALAVSAIGICQHQLGLSWIPQSQPPASTFANRNMAAEFVALCLPFGIGSAVLGRNVWVRGLGGVSITLSVVFFVLTHSRGAQLAAMVVVAASLVLVFLWLLASWKVAIGGRRSLLLASTVILLVLLTGMVSSAFRLSMAGAEERSGQLRVIYWENTLRMAADHPWGVGLANFKFVYPLYHRAVAVDWSFDDRFAATEVHNDHLQVLAELGLPGFLAWAAMFLAFHVQLMRVLARGPGPVRIKAVLVALGVLAFLVVASVSFPLERAMPPVHLFVLFGLMARWHMAAGGRVVALRVGGPVRVVLVLVPLALLAASFHLVRGALLADRYRDEGVVMANAGEADQAVARLELARSHAPGDADLGLLIAGVRIGQGQWDAALDELNRALRLDPHRVSAHLHRGFCLVRLGRIDEAEEAFRQTLVIMPDFVPAHQNLGLIRSQRGEHEAAAVHFEAAIESALGRARYAARPVREQEIVPLRAQLGREYAAAGRIEEAAQQFERVLDVQPDLQDVRRLLEALRHDAR